MMGAMSVRRLVPPLTPPFAPWRGERARRGRHLSPRAGQALPPARLTPS
jgi:hypothetical protein